MQIVKQAEDLDNGVTEVAHKIEVVCPECSRDVDEAELAAKTCSDCGADLSEPTQSVQLHVTSVPIFAVTF
jgi:Zn finger protein HypA/HybF involved in hydrogenase expression